MFDTGRALGIMVSESNSIYEINMKYKYTSHDVSHISLMAAHFCVFLFLYFYFCIFVKKKGWKLLSPPLTSLHRSLSLRPDSESKLWVESTAGRRRSTHLNWFFYFTFLWAELFLCESYCRDRRHHCFVSQAFLSKQSSKTILGSFSGP